MTWAPPVLPTHADVPHRYPSSMSQPGRSPLASALSKSIAGRFVRDMVQRRDAGRCRLCGVPVHGLGGNGDRRSPRRGTYVRVDELQPLTVDNVVIACATCRAIWERDPGCLTLLVPPPVPVVEWWVP